MPDLMQNNLGILRVRSFHQHTAPLNEFESWSLETTVAIEGDAIETTKSSSLVKRTPDSDNNVSDVVVNAAADSQYSLDLEQGQVECMRMLSC